MKEEACNTYQDNPQTLASIEYKVFLLKINKNKTTQQKMDNQIEQALHKTKSPNEQ